MRKNKNCPTCGRPGFAHTKLEVNECKAKINSGEDDWENVFKTNDVSELGLLEIKEPITLRDCVRMNGHEFEKVLKRLYQKIGYRVRLTKGSGDQGADLILYDGETVTIIQAKNHKDKLSNTAVQEIVGAIAFYKANVGMVVTTSDFHKGARSLAEANNVRLVNGIKLEKMLQDYPISKNIKMSPSDITAADIYEDNPEWDVIIKQILAKILAERRQMHGYGETGNALRKDIDDNLKIMHISPSDRKDCITKVFELLKNEYEIDVYQEPDPKILHRYQPSDSAMQLFMKVLKELEGEPKKPVEQNLLCKEFIKLSWKVTENEAIQMIRKMTRESSIYESKPGHYNTV